MTMTLTQEELFAIFRETGALREGHFLLTSGRHSDRFFLMPHIFQFPEQTERVCEALATLCADMEVDTVVGPATGGIILAFGVARHLGLIRGRSPRAIFAEKTGDGTMALRRGWTLAKGERVLVVEDAITTGGSIMKTISAIAQYEPEIVGIGAICDRSGGTAPFPAPLRSLVTLTVDSWAPGECPLCQQGVKLVKPKA